MDKDGITPLTKLAKLASLHLISTVIKNSNSFPKDENFLLSKTLKIMFYNAKAEYREITSPNLEIDLPL